MQSMLPPTPGMGSNLTSDGMLTNREEAPYRQAAQAMLTTIAGNAALRGYTHLPTQAYRHGIIRRDGHGFDPTIG